MLGSCSREVDSSAICEVSGGLKVSVFIPTKNRCESLRAMLDSLTKQSYKNFEVIVVDGGSNDGTDKLVSSYQDRIPVKFAIQSGGLIAQANKGLEMASGDVFVRTDDDAVAPPHWIQEIVNTFNLSEKIGGVTGPTITPKEHVKNRDLLLFQEKLQNKKAVWRIIGKIYYDYILEGKAMEINRFVRSGAFTLGSNFPYALKLREPIEVDVHDCCTMACRKELLKKIGGFDETFAGVSEYNEPDVSYKIRKMGYKILFNPRASIYHYPSKSGAFGARANSYGRIINFITFYFRHLKPDTIDKFFRFIVYLLFQDLYYLYKFFHSGQISYLGCLPGSIIGIAKNIFQKKLVEVT